ncbi:MAG: hypothetical protein OET90_01855, partial [Desulfuromonadales bacterium]|nr:hypothetical protein [Desulfuromonadales bacterium]
MTTATEDATEEAKAPSKLLLILTVTVSLLHLWFNVLTVLPPLWQNALHFSGFALIAALLYPSSKTGGLGWRLLDLSLGLLAAGS